MYRLFKIKNTQYFSKKLYFYPFKGNSIRFKTFKTPLTIAQTLSCIANSDNTTIKDSLLYNLHSKDCIEDMSIEANSNDFIRNIKTLNFEIQL